MENIYNLDEFSSEKENENEASEKNDIPYNNITSENEYTINDLALMKSFSAGKPNISCNTQLSKINAYDFSNDSYDLKYQNLIFESKAQNSEIKINSFNSITTEKKQVKKFSNAIEDDIDISEFDKIENPAMKFEFTLDNFQKRSIIRLEQEKNILVCAHTSSGKTLVAEYGIAVTRRNKKRIIYTAPIKALSNQK